MMEITTGVVFLMTSLYGSGQMATEIATVAMAGKVANAAMTAVSTSTNSRSFTDSKELEKYLREEFADNPVMVDIARCESTFRHFGEDGRTPIRGIANKSDIGVMQINEYYHGETAKKMGIDLKTVEGNVQFGQYLYDKYGTSPWKASEPCWGAPKDLAKAN